METKTYPQTADRGTEGRREDEPGGREELAAGTVVGRYLVLSAVGRGGMGIVYAAYDPQLERKVALKVLRRREGEREDLDRQLEEARSLARLAHPNVVRIYDAGVFEGQVFLAMEFLQGETLKQWLADGRRGWREVVQVFRQAGEGLLAAHRAGLVHGDFKPSNMLLAADGGVRVLDFGAARASGSEGRGREGAGVAGTPGYLAPEVLAGSTPDPRSDQYGFAVSLHEALFGGTPGAAGPWQRPAPAWLREVVERGLAPDPRLRFPSMEELLGVLSRRVRRRWAGWFWAAAGFAAATVLATVYSGEPAEAPAVCSGAETRLAGIWDPSRRRQVQAAFTATGVDFAEETGQRVGQHLDRFAAEWTAMYTETCRATHVLGEQSETLLDMRMQCLAVRLGELKGLADLFAGADAALVSRAMVAVEGLGELDECADRELLLSLKTLPEEKAAREEVREARAALGELFQRISAERTGDPAEVEAWIEAGRRLNYPPLEAQAYLTLSHVHSVLGDTEKQKEALHRALFAALSGKDRLQEAAIATALASFSAYDEVELEDARWWLRFAEGAVAGLGPGHHRQEITLLSTRGLVELKASRLEEARDFYRRALELEERTFPGDSIREAILLTNLAIASTARSVDPQEPLRLLQRSLEIRESRLGAGNPMLAPPLINLASVQAEQGYYAEALEQTQRALDVLERFYGRHRDLAYPLGIQGQVLSVMDRPRQAEEALREALETAEEGYGADHPLAGEMLTALGVTLLLDGRPEEASPVLERARAIFDALLPADHEARTDLEFALGRLHLSRGDAGASLNRLRRARRFFDESDRNHSQIWLLIRHDLGEAHLELGDEEQAAAVLEEALTIERPAADGHAIAALRFALARAVVRRQPQRALELASSAVPGLASGGSAWTRERARRLEAWLALHDRTDSESHARGRR